MDFYWVLIVFLFVMMGFQMYSAYKQNKKQQQQTLTFQQSLKPGDEVVLTNGIYGTIDSLSETTATIEVSPKSVIKVDRTCVYRFANPKPIEPVTPVEPTAPVEEKKEEAVVAPEEVKNEVVEPVVEKKTSVKKKTTKKTTKKD